MPKEDEFIKMESIINFRRGQTVMFNPHAHGFILLDYYHKSKNTKGKVKKVNEIERTVTVCWHKSSFARKYNYQRLLII